jgi:hypothetical protein
VSQVSLTGDCFNVGFEFLKQRSFSTYVVEIEKLFGVGISILEPTCCRELVLSRNLVLQGVRQVALRYQKYVSDCLSSGLCWSWIFVS